MRDWPSDRMVGNTEESSPADGRQRRSRDGYGLKPRPSCNTTSLVQHGNDLRIPRLEDAAETPRSGNPVVARLLPRLLLDQLHLDVRGNRLVLGRLRQLHADGRLA